VELRIKDGVFEGGDFGEDITEAVIPEGVREIRRSAFSEEEGLVCITIPASVEKIGEYAFYMCYGLREIRVAEGNRFFSSRDGVLFDRDGKTLLLYPLDRQEKEYHIPDGTEIIGRRAFSEGECGCGSLERIILPDSVKVIGEDAFEGCDELGDILIPDSPEQIGRGAFAGCYKMERIKVGEKNKFFCSVDGVLFSRDMKVLLQYPSGALAESYCIPEGTEKIADYAFTFCHGLKRVTIPDSVSEIGQDAFGCCNALEEVRMPKRMSKLGSRAFSNCGALKSIVIPEGVERIEERMFSGCPNRMTEIVMPDTVTAIGAEAFSFCIGLKKIDLPDSVIRIEKAAFRQTEALEEIVLPESVTYIGNMAFHWCKKLRRVVIKNPDAFIGEKVFYGCGELREVVLGDRMLPVEKLCKEELSGDHLRRYTGDGFPGE